MKAIIFMTLSFILGVASLCYFSYNEGRKSAQKEIESRVLETDEKECYTTADIELLIFGDTQP